MEKIPVMLLGARQYSFTNDRGELLEGVSVHYISLAESDTQGLAGYLPAKANLKLASWNYLKDLSYPLLADAGFTIDLSSKRNQIKVTSFEAGNPISY